MFTSIYDGIKGTKMLAFSMKLNTDLRLRFLILTPVIILFAAGIFVKSTHKVIPFSGCTTTDFSGLPSSDSLAIYNGKEIAAPPTLLADAGDLPVLGVATPSDRWIEVDLSDQKLMAWDGESLFLETLISTGLPGTPTPKGEFYVWVKLRATRMEGGSGSGYYNLPNVPYVMFFENDDVPGWRGYSLHGTYWHNDFGSQRSHGCVNVPTPVAEKLYNWALPIVPDNSASTFSNVDNPGIRVVIHD